MASKNIPFYVACKLTALVQQACSGSSPPPTYIAERLDIILSDTLADVGGCERILSTPIPLSYTR